MAMKQKNQTLPSSRKSFDYTDFSVAAIDILRLVRLVSLFIVCLSVFVCLPTCLFLFLLLYLCCLFVVLFICSLSHCLFHDLFLSMSVFVCLPACPFSLFICSSLFSIFVLLFVCSQDRPLKDRVENIPGRLRCNFFDDVCGCFLSISLRNNYLAYALLLLLLLRQFTQKRAKLPTMTCATLKLIF